MPKVFAKAKNGKTPLRYSAEKGYKVVRELLCQSGQPMPAQLASK